MSVIDVPTVVDDNSGINVAQATKSGYIFCPVGGVFDMSYPKSKLRRGRVQGNGHISPTLTCSPEMLWVVDSITDDKTVRLRRYTERECFRLMGVSDSDIDKLENSDIRKSQLYKMSGNSIVVDVLFEMFRTLFIEKNSEKGQSDALF